MSVNMEDPFIFKCNGCSNTYIRKGSLNRHVRDVHKEEPGIAKKSHIKCILCSADEVVVLFPTYIEYNKHLQEVHQVIVKVSMWAFPTKEGFDLWLEKDKRNVNYAYHSGTKSIFHMFKYYNCNRTDSKGFQSKCTKNILKAGGSIKLHGSCPSRMIVRIYENGQTRVQFYETHLGHEDEVRAQVLTKKEQAYLVEQLKAGISKDKIIANARNYNLPESGLPGRINSISKNDLSNLIRRYKVENISPKNDLIGQRQMFIKKYMCLVNEMASTDKDSFHYFQGLMDMVYLLVQERRQQNSRKRKIDSQNTSKITRHCE